MKSVTFAISNEEDFQGQRRIATTAWECLSSCSCFPSLSLCVCRFSLNLECWQTSDFFCAEDLKNAGLDDSGEEINVVAYDKEGKKFPMPPTDDFDSDVLADFVEDFLAGPHRGHTPRV